VELASLIIASIDGPPGPDAQDLRAGENCRRVSEYEKDPSSADDWEAIKARVRRIRGIGKPAAEVSRTSDVRKIAVAGFPYRVVYRELPALLYVVALAHFRRKTGYWRHR
jgi:hypothetical protein